MSYDVRKLKGILTVAVAVIIILVTASVLVFVLCRADIIEINGTELYYADEIIEASRIETGIFLYSVDREKAQSSILSECTLISDVNIRLKLPNRVIITVTEDAPVFYTEVGVSTVMFGPDLRIAEVRQNSEQGNGIFVLMPEIASAVAGERLTFKSGEPSYVTKLLYAAVATELFDRITLISCENARDAYFEVDGKYKLIFGGASELDVKLQVAKEYLANTRIANASSAILDLTSPKEVIVTVND